MDDDNKACLIGVLICSTATYFGGLFSREIIELLWGLV